MVVVVSQPDRPRGRGQRPDPSPVARAAEQRGIPLLRPERVGDPESVAAIAGFEPDLGVVVAYGQFLPRRVREAPRLGYLVNGHASLLPRGRGAAPIARAILDGETKTGVSVMRVEREMDAGPVAATAATPIGPDESAGDLALRMAGMTAELVARVVDEIADGRVVWTPQDASRASFAPKLERAEAELDWTEPAATLARRVRGFAPRPGAWALLAGEPLRILAARALPGPVDRPPGRVRVGGDPPLRVATGDGWLVPRVLQRAGRRPLGVEEFLRGHPLPDDTQLGGKPPVARLEPGDATRSPRREPT